MADSKMKTTKRPETAKKPRMFHFHKLISINYASNTEDWVKNRLTEP